MATWGASSCQLPMEIGDDTVLGVAGVSTVRDAQAAEVDDLGILVALVHGGVLRTAMDAGLGKGGADFGQFLDVIVMRMGDKNMPQHEAFLGNHVEHGLGVETGVEEGGVALDLVPEEVAIHQHAVGVGGGDDADFAPDGQIGFWRQPAVGNAFKFLGLKAEQLSERGEIELLAALAGGLEGGQFAFGNAGGGACGGGGNVVHHPRLADDVAKMVFKLHAETVA